MREPALLRVLGDLDDNHGEPARSKILLSQSTTALGAKRLTGWLARNAATFQRPREALGDFRRERLQGDLVAGLTAT